MTGVMLFCEDIRAQTAWYRDVLGFQPDKKQPFPLNRLVRFSNEEGASLALHSGTKPNGGRQKLMFQCDSVEKLVARPKASGRRVRRIEPSATMVFDVNDPEGNRIQVYGPW
jgi:catechol 2,3-dioxygenase-like lactoylglutathione lyase family enzyme